MNPGQQGGYDAGHDDWAAYDSVPGGTGGPGPDNKVVAVVAAVAAVVLVALLVVLFVARPGAGAGGGNEPGAAVETLTSTVTPTSTAPSSSGTSTTRSSTSSSRSSTSSSTTTRSSTTRSSTSNSTTRSRIDRPSGVVEQCSDSRASVLPRSGTGTSSTSCQFARSVREAYLGAGGDGGSARVDARSPVTGLTYDMACSGNGDVVVCRGGGNATVYLY